MAVASCKHICSGAVQGRQQGLRPIMGTQTAWGTWLSVCAAVASGFCYRHTAVEAGNGPGVCSGAGQ